MKRLFLILYFLSQGASSLFAQDTLFLKGRPPQLVRILAIKVGEVEFKRFDYQDGPVFSSPRSDVEKIHYAGGLKDYFQSPDKPETGMAQPAAKDSVSNIGKEIPPGNTVVEAETWNGKRLDQLGAGDGELDAMQFYRGYKLASAASFVGGTNLIFGLPIPVITSLAGANNAYKYAPNPRVLQVNPAYSKGFSRRANKMKARKVWANYAYGAGTTVAFFTLLVLAIAGAL